LTTLGGANAVSRFVRAGDGVDLHYLRWASGPAKPWAAVIFLHGIASHATWFAETAADLDLNGVAVYAPDRRGSGLSRGVRGHLASYARALDDVEDVVKLVASEHKGAPLFLAGSSWAAKLALVYAARRPAPLSGLMLLGPGLLPQVTLSAARRAAVAIGHVVAPTARIAIPLTPELYTTTVRYLEFIRADRLRLTAATTRFFWETARLDRHRPRASVRLHLPLLVLQGEGDAMMDVAKTREWFSTLDVEDKTYRSYPGAGHTLDFEPDRTQYVDDLLTWLRTRVPARSAHPTYGS
jgi:alpha-beta hydrolase superfamily lysophospholipase